MDESHFDDLMDQALDALSAGDYLRAVGLGDQLAAAAPDHAAVRAIRAQALLGSDAADEAFEEARRAAELSPADAHGQRILAFSAWRTGRLGLAQESFQRVIALSGHRPSVLSDYAWFMATERGPRPAEEAARAAIEADANSSTAWAALGLAAYRLHRREEAEESLRRALQLDPNDIYAQSAMAVLLQDRRQDTRAEALAGLLESHRGTEDMVASIRSEAKDRQLARMLLERQVDPGGPPPEPRRYGWIWLLAVATVLAVMFAAAEPHYAVAALLCVLLPLVLVWRFWRAWD